jgi:hypothetical protein
MMRQLINLANSPTVMAIMAVIGLAIVGMDVYAWRP